MTVSSEPPPGAPAHGQSRPVLLAAVLGGLLGGVCAFALFRTFPAPPPPPTTTPQSEARPLADELIGLLKTGKNEQFLTGVRQAFSGLNDEQFNQVRQHLLKSREKYAADYGPTTDFEFVRETSLGSNLVRFAYLERFPRGCVVWIIVYYYAPDGWQVLGYKQMPIEVAFEALK